MEAPRVQSTKFIWRKFILELSFDMIEIKIDFSRIFMWTNM